MNDPSQTKRTKSALQKMKLLLLLALGCVVHAQDFSNVQEMMEYNVAR